MPYDDPNLKEFDTYYQARSASKRDLLVGISDEEKAALGKGGKATSKKRSEKSGQVRRAKLG